MKLFILLLLTISCSSKKEIVQGYEGAKLQKALKAVQGKNQKEILKILGKPAIHGVCKSCGQKQIYRMVYLKKDSARFYLELSYNTDMEVDCFVLDLMFNTKQNAYIFDRALGFYEGKNCNQQDGIILEMKQILDL